MYKCKLDWYSYSATLSCVLQLFEGGKEETITLVYRQRKLQWSWVELMVTCIVWQAWLPLLVRMAETACRIFPVSPQATTRLNRQAQDRAVMVWPVGSLGPVLRTVVSSNSWNRDSERRWQWGKIIVGKYKMRIITVLCVFIKIVIPVFKCAWMHLLTVLCTQHWLNVKVLKENASKFNTSTNGLLFKCFQPYQAHQEAQSGSPQVVVPAAYPARPACCAGIVKGGRNESPLSAQTPHTGQCQ